ncbi:MoaD/ThiS family protein [Candidatus Aerophobetes bacterium]|nr:MoaD/ThiS family protein [Candidatus Aerophobetes bacterium]
MKVIVKLLGSLSIVAGIQSAEVELEEDNNTVERIVDKIVGMYGGEKIKRRIFTRDGGVAVTLALNGTWCSLDAKVKDGDEICIMPPISGG